MGCKQCKTFLDKTNNEITGESLVYISNTNKVYQEHSNNSLTKEGLMEYQVDLESADEITQEFKTKKNDIKKFKKEEIIEQASRISQEFLARPDRSQKKIQFDSLKFEKGLMRLIQSPIV